MGRLFLLATLRQAGFEEDRNLSVEWRFAEGDMARLPALAEELVRLNVEVIIASFNHLSNNSDGALPAGPNIRIL